MRHRINVERKNVAALRIQRVILRLVGPHAPAIPVIPRHALPQVQHHRAGGVGLLDLQVVGDVEPGDHRAGAVTGKDRGIY